MKKAFFFFFLIIILTVLFFLIKPIRTKHVLLNIANDEFENICIYDSVRDQLEGPISVDKGNFVEFKWFKVLGWGDTAAVFIDIYKYPTSFSWRDSFYWPRVTMNYQWRYLNGKLSKFEYIYPNRYNNKPFTINKLQLHSNQNEYLENTEVLINPDRLFYFLKEGYFEILDKKEDYTVVAFYQPIGNVFELGRDKIDTINTMAAKVFINEASEIIIVPYNAPSELWGKSRCTRP